MYGNNYGYYNPTRNIGVPVNNQYIQQPIQQIQPTITPGLQGKAVDSLDVVKALDIPLDGSTSYFPLIDGSAIITKKLQTDGTTKTTIYKATEEKEISLPKYATVDDIKKEIDKIDVPDLEDIKEEIKEIKKDLKELKKKKGDE